MGVQGVLLTVASFRRCTPCTAGRGPASSRPRRSFPRASSATGPSAALPPLLPGEPSKGTSPPDSPSSAPAAFSLACLLAALAVGALNNGYAQHRPREGLAGVLPPSSATSSPILPKGRGGRDRAFFFTEEKRKKKSCLLWWWSGRIRSSGNEVHSPPPCTHIHTQTHTCTYMCTLGITS